MPEQTTVQAETKRLAQEAALWLDRALDAAPQDRPAFTSPLRATLHQALGKLADIIVLNADA